MAHLVRYETNEGDRFAPSGDERVGSGKRCANRQDDVMLVSSLLNMRYTMQSDPKYHIDQMTLPRGARRIIGCP